MPDPKRILIVKLHGIGNIVLLLPALRQLKRRFPGAELDFLSFRTNAGILDETDEIAARHYLDRGSPWKLFRSTIRAIVRARRRAYDLTIDFEQFAHFSALLSLVTGAPRRIGFRNPTLRRHLAFTTSVVYGDTAHISRTFSRLALAAGDSRLSDAPREITVKPNHRLERSAFLEASGIRPDEPVVVLHPGSSENLTLRRWAPERFAQLGDRLADEFGVRIVISGGTEDRPLAEAVKGLMRVPSTVAAGRVSLHAFASLCERALFVVSNDTAAVHVASAMGTPVVGLYGPNTPFLYGPLGDNDLVFYRQLPCSPCFSNLTSKVSNCRRALCMETIAVETVVDGIRERYFGGIAGLPAGSRSPAAPVARSGRLDPGIGCMDP